MNITEPLLNFLLKKDRLKEEENSDLAEEIDPVEEKQLENEVIAEGQIPQDASGVTSDNFDELNPIGYVDISFESGNLTQLEQIPEMTLDKISSLKQTLIPLIEKSLIELMGSSSMWKRKSANVQASFQPDGSISLVGTLVYQVDLWIGLDVNQEDIDHDQKYVMSTISPMFSTIKVTQLSINTEDGTLNLSFNM